MKNILCVCITLFCAAACFAQPANTIIKTQAMDMAKALLRKDFPAFVKYMHPKIIALAGGKDKLINRMDTMNVTAAQFGAEIKKVLIGNPSNIIHYKNELQATVPQTTEMVSGFGSVTFETSLIAISPDEGKHWYFIDTSVYNVKDVQKAMPDLSPDLVIPPAKPPKIIPNKQ